MIALAAAILAATHPEGLLALYGAGTPQRSDRATATASASSGLEAHSAPGALTFAVRGFDRDFEAFDQQVLCCAVSPAPEMRAGRRLGLIVEDSTEVMARYGTSRLSELRREIACWVAVLAPGSAADCRRLEARATASLLSNAHAQCAYRLPPLAVHAARPIVVVQLSVLQSFGRERFLRALWESQTAGAGNGQSGQSGQTGQGGLGASGAAGVAGSTGGAAGAPYEQGSLFDSLDDRLRQHFRRMSDGGA